MFCRGTCRLEYLFSITLNKWLYDFSAKGETTRGLGVDKSLGVDKVLVTNQRYLRSCLQNKQTLQISRVTIFGNLL